MKGAQEGFSRLRRWNTLLAALLLLCLAAKPAAAQAPSAPVARQDNVKEQMHGIEIVDPYRWLEEQDSQETKDWVMEFQSSLAQMEKDVAAQLSTLKAQVDRSIQTREADSQPGLIEITVPNADKADAGKVQLRLEGPAKITADLQP